MGIEVLVAGLTLIANVISVALAVFSLSMILLVWLIRDAADKQNSGLLESSDCIEAEYSVVTE
jgi:hypothetical protein